MNNNAGNFFAHDPYGFEKYLVKVESGKGSMSGAAMLPHELVAQIIARALRNTGFLTIPAVVEARNALA